MIGALRAATPTGRTAAVLALIGLAAFVAPSWLAAGTALVLFAAVVADAWAVREPPQLQRAVASVISRGRPASLSARAVAADGRRVVVRQPPAPGTTISADQATGGLAAELVAQTRGRHRLPGVASASVGPLGLARVHHPSGPEAELRVYPDVVGARRLVLRLRRQMLGRQSGPARGPLGLGTEFESVREYATGDDIRRVNWRATARLGRPMSNQYRIERDRQVVCVVDCGRLTGAAIGDLTVLDAALDAVTVIALASDELGDRFGAIAFDDGVRRALSPRHLGGARAVEQLFDLTSRPVDSDFELAFARIGRSQRAHVFVHTDLIDEAAARSLLTGVAMLVRRHAVVIAGAADPELERLAADGADPEQRIVALEMLDERRRTATRLRRAGAQVLEAPAGMLAERCLAAYLRAKR